MNRINNWNLRELPPEIDLESRRVLKSLPKTKDSSAIENIITTHDELYKCELNLKSVSTLAAKEVQNYIAAPKRGFVLVSKREILTSNMIIEIQQMIEGNKAGFRKLPGTILKNATLLRIRL